MNNKIRSKLDGRIWTKYSISVWNDIQKNPQEKRLKHPALFPTALVERLLEIYAHRGEMILDPFLGSGSTLIAAQRLGMKGIGLDISKDYIRLFHKRLLDEKADSYTVQAINDDARYLSKYVAPGTVDLCLTSPPYWNVLRARRSADFKPGRYYSDDINDLGNIGNYDLFLDELKCVFSEVYTALKKGEILPGNSDGYQEEKQVLSLHMDLTRNLTDLGFILDDIIIWDRRMEYNNLRPLGFPYVFRVNKVHEYILIFQKPDREVQNEH